MWLLMVGVALAGGRWEGAEADIVAQRTIDAPAETLFEELLDLESVVQMFPDHCATDIAYGEKTEGKGAKMALTYHFATMHRSLEAEIVKVEPHHIIDIEHATSRGFFTRFQLEPGEGGTEVTMTSYIDPPPWPLRRAYYVKVRPAWVQCYLDALVELEAMVAQ